MNVAVCDDDPSELQYMCQLLQEYAADSTDNPIHIHTFSSAITLMDYMKKCPVDVYVLDILMPGINGIELGQYIRKQDTDVPIVYITSVPDFALQSYSVQAADYILKPITADTVFCLMERLQKRYQLTFHKRWSIKTKSGFYSVPYHEIVYIEYQEHRMNCYLSCGKIIKSSTLRISFDEAAAELIEDSRFLKISASFLINMSFVTKVTAKEFMMKDNKCLTITRRYKDARKIYIDFLLHGGT